MAKLNNTSDMQLRMQNKGNNLPLLVGMQMCTATIEINMVVPYHPSIPLDTSFYHKDSCLNMIVAVLFIIARNCKEPRCPSNEEWIKKMWFIYTMEYYSAVRK